MASSKGEGYKVHPMEERRLPDPVRTIDTSGTLCPLPIVETAKAVKALAAGDVLLVIALDMPMWCKATRHEHLATFREGAAWKSYVRKRS